MLYALPVYFLLRYAALVWFAYRMDVGFMQMHFYACMCANCAASLSVFVFCFLRCSHTLRCLAIFVETSFAQSYCSQHIMPDICSKNSEIHQNPHEHCTCRDRTKRTEPSSSVLHYLMQSCLAKKIFDTSATSALVFHKQEHEKNMSAATSLHLKNIVSTVYQRCSLPLPAALFGIMLGIAPRLTLDSRRAMLSGATTLRTLGFSEQAQQLISI